MGGGGGGGGVLDPSQPQPQWRSPQENNKNKNSSHNRTPLGVGGILTGWLLINAPLGPAQSPAQPSKTERELGRPAELNCGCGRLVLVANAMPIPSHPPSKLGQ